MVGGVRRGRPAGYALMQGGTHVKLYDGSTPFLERLAKDYPREFRRSLGRIGWWLRGEVQDAMRTGGLSAGERWPERSLIARFAPFERMRNKRWKTDKGREAAREGFREADSLQDVMLRHSPLLRRGGKGKNNISAFGSGRLTGAVRYKVDDQAGGMSIGFLNSSSSEAAFRLQAARRGSSAAGEFTGSQPVTEKMRRMFWAAGIPISKHTKVIKQKKRDLIQPVFDMNRAKIPKRIELYVSAYLKKLDSKHAGSYVRQRL